MSVWFKGFGLRWAVVGAALFFSAGVHAQEPVSIHKIGVVNLGKLFDEYRETKTSEAQLDKLSKEKQTERERIVSEVKTMREELLLLNEQARQERQGEIEQKLKQLSEFDQEVRNTLMRKRDESVKGIFDKIEGVVTQYAKQHGYELILSDRAVLYGIDAADVTDEILNILNKSS